MVGCPVNTANQGKMCFSLSRKSSGSGPTFAPVVIVDTIHNLGQSRFLLLVHVNYMSSVFRM